MNNCKITCLEDLPNELFYDLFPYFEIRCLYRAFFRLNFRLNVLLSSLPEVYLCINGPDDRYYEIAECLSRITHVRIKKECPNISFRVFRLTVHSMFVDRISDEQVQELREFLYLKHLQIVSIYRSSYVLRPFSHRLNFTIPSALSNLMINSLLNLTSISIPIYVPADFSTILASAPNLVQLSMCIFQNRSSSPTHTKQISAALRRLNIHWYFGFNYSYFDFYLTQVPHIHSLYLSIGPCIMSTMEQVYEILDKIGSSIDLHLVYLRRFSFSIKIHVNQWCCFDVTRLSSVFAQRIRYEQCEHRLIVSHLWTRFPSEKMVLSRNINLIR